MRNAIILHGKPDPGDREYYNPNFPAASNSHWIPWLQKQLMVRDIYTQTPEIPNAWKPDYVTWCKEFERYDITPETILVGHSCGGGFLVRWLSEHPEIRVDKVVLVAPWLDPDRQSTIDFFEFTINPQLATQAEQFHIFNSDDDADDIHRSVAAIRVVLSQAIYREFHGYGHFCLHYKMETEAFPELLDAITSNESEQKTI